MIIPIVAGAILGMAFNFDEYRKKPDYIFDQDEVNKNIVVIPKAYTQTRYRLIQTSSDSTNMLDINGELSLKVKKGDINLGGYGKYMEQKVNRANSVEMLLTVYHETQTETFPTYIKTRDDWKSKPQRNVGTHYIKSITYGGQLMISYVLKANKDEYVEDIRAAVNANLAVSGSLNVNVSGQIDKLLKEVEGKSSVEISVYATVGVFDPPMDMKGCLDLVKRYPGWITAEHGGKGSALKIDIEELSTINQNYTAYRRNQALDGMLDDAINKFDDLQMAWEQFTMWEEKGGDFDDKWDEVIDDYRERLNNAKYALEDVISNLDSTKGIEQFDEAFRLYGEHELNIPNRYMREFKNLTHHVEGKPFYWFPYTTAVSSYVHWGVQSCTLPSPKPLYVGYAASAPVGFGNGGNIQCLPGNKPKLVPKKIGNNTHSEINGLLYELPNQKSGQALCAFCKLENATVAYTISGRSECPEDMKLEYKGFLTAARDAGTGTEFICMDEESDDQIPADNSRFADTRTATLNPVWSLCPDCDEDENQKYISCVVCSR